MQLTPLQQRTTRDIILHIRQQRYPAGQHLTASSLAAHLNVSRSPVNAALAYLAEAGVVTHDRNRGFFLTFAAEEIGRRFASLLGPQEDSLYQQIVDLRLAGELSDQMLETDLMRLLDTSRANVGKLLSRIQEEGWIEKRAGKGWEFLAMIDSKEAYEESYVYRLTLEPAALLSPKFKADSNELRSCLEQQRFIVEGGYLDLSPFELFEANCNFHESLMRWSNNRFFLQSLVRLNNLRRLVEYRQASLRAPRRDHSREHITILESIMRGDQVEASGILRQHLNQARTSKAETFMVEGSEKLSAE